MQPLYCREPLCMTCEITTDYQAETAMKDYPTLPKTAQQAILHCLRTFAQTYKDEYPDLLEHVFTFVELRE